MAGKTPDMEAVLLLSALVCCVGLARALCSRTPCWWVALVPMPGDNIPGPSTLCITRTAIHSLPHTPALWVLLPKPQQLRKAFAAHLVVDRVPCLTERFAGEQQGRVATESTVPRLRVGPWRGQKPGRETREPPSAALRVGVGPPSSHSPPRPATCSQSAYAGPQDLTCGRRWEHGVFNAGGGSGTPPLTCCSSSNERKVATEIRSRALK